MIGLFNVWITMATGISTSVRAQMSRLSHNLRLSRKTLCCSNSMSPLEWRPLGQLLHLLDHFWNDAFRCQYEQSAPRQITPISKVSSAARVFHVSLTSNTERRNGCSNRMKTKVNNYGLWINWDPYIWFYPDDIMVAQHPRITVCFAWRTLQIVTDTGYNNTKH